MLMVDVVALLTDLSIRCEPGPLGVAFSWGGERYRIESGGGIAGRGHAWSVVELPATTLGPKVTTRRALRAQVLAVMADPPKPDPKPGCETYARWHRTGVAASVQWFTRRSRGARTTAPTRPRRSS
jgi:hypothetical protein